MLLRHDRDLMLVRDFELLRSRCLVVTEEYRHYFRWCPTREPRDVLAHLLLEKLKKMNRRSHLIDDECEEYLSILLGFNQVSQAKGCED